MKRSTVLPHIQERILPKYTVYTDDDSPNDFSSKFWRIELLSGASARPWKTSSLTTESTHSFPCCSASSETSTIPTSTDCLTVVPVAAAETHFENIRGLSERQTYSLIAEHGSLEDGAKTRRDCSRPSGPDLKYDFKATLAIAVRHAAAGPSGVTMTKLQTLLHDVPIPEVKEVVRIVSAAVK